MSRAGLKICALIAARNEYPYLRLLLPVLAEQQIDVVIFDNESSDESNILYRKFSNHPVIEIVQIPYRGYFSLHHQLEHKYQLLDKLPYDWYIHQDADELLTHRNGCSLRSAIEEAEGAGYNCLNFDEFVFLPEPEEDYRENDFFAKIRNYYFFEPTPCRLNRAFKKLEKMDFVNQGGHRIVADILKINPVNHTLRHYITLSQEHLRQKYLHRIFDPRDVNKGWHKNRDHFTPRNLILPSVEKIPHRFDPAQPSQFDRSNPQILHFWDW